MSNHKGLSVLGLTMLALGTVVGGSFFLGSAISIRNSGPSVILAYLLGGILIYFILFALSEMTVANPNSGSFQSFAEYAFGKGMGFVVGWLYWTGLVLAMSSEAVAVSTFILPYIPQASIYWIGVIIIILVTLTNLIGTEKLSTLESALASVKLLAIVGFIVIAFLLITGFYPNQEPVGLGALKDQSIFPNGVSGLLGSMLIIIFTYAGFEIIGLAASETPNPHVIIPKAIKNTAIALVGLYTISTFLLLPLVPTQMLTNHISPFVMGLDEYNITWASSAINFIMITAILSTMLAATFGLARMLRSLSVKGYTPPFLKEKGDVPYKGILFSGFAMLFAFSLSFVLPASVYIFLVSSGGFVFLFIYFIIMASHYRIRKKDGCPPKGHCQLPLYPYSSYISMIALLIFMISMPLVIGQGSGLIAGVTILIFYSSIYYFFFRRRIDKE